MQVSLHLTKVEIVPSIIEFKEALRANGDPVWESYFPIPTESAIDYVKRLSLRITHPAPNLVPETVYWGVANNTVVGRISLRHTLNENLKKMGGHIGYEVHPAFRQRGVATDMLKAILQTPQAIQIGSLLLTCNPENIGSNKTILSNGGVLEKREYVESLKEDRHYYWIKI